MNAKAVTAIQAVITLALLAWLFRGFDWAAFGALYTRLPLWFYGWSLAVIIAGQLLYAWRWQVLLGSVGAVVPFGVVLRLYFIGIFANNFLPSTVGGDATKVYYLGRRHGYRVVTASVLLDRLLGVGLLAAVAAALLWLDAAAHPRYLAVRLALSAIVAGLAAVIGVALWGTGGLPQRLARFGPRAVAFATHLQEFRGHVSRALRSPGVWLQALAVVVSNAALLALVYQQFSGLLTGVRPPLPALLMAIASVSVLSNVPVAINGIGLREQLHVLLLAPLGVSREVAVAVSLLLFGHLLAASLVGGGLWWLSEPVQAGASSKSTRLL